MNVELWADDESIGPVGQFIKDQDLKARKKILWVIDLLEEKGGKLIHTKYMKKLHGYELYELIPQYRGLSCRILFVIINQTAWLLHAFKKETNHTPQKEINVALFRMEILRATLGSANPKQ